MGKTKSKHVTHTNGVIIFSVNGYRDSLLEMTVGVWSISDGAW